MTRIKLDDRDAGIAGRVACAVPIHDKRLGWTMKKVRVAYYVGESPQDAERFASDIARSWTMHHVAHESRPVPEGRPVHPQPVYLAPMRGTDEINAQAAAFDARRGKPAADTYVAAVARKSQISGSRRRVERAATVKAPRAATKLDPCPRCARADFRSEKGRDWHLANNPACATWRKPEKHAYAVAA